MAKLTSRERIIRTLNHQEPDRVPIDIGGISTLTTLHRDAYSKLKDYLGYKNDQVTITSKMSQSVLPDEYIRQRFKADCYPLYTTGPRPEWIMHKEEDGSTWYKDEWGVKWWCPVGGLYFDPVGYPLKGCSIEDLEKYPWPDPRDRRYVEGLKDKAKDLYENTDYALVLSGPFYGGIYVPCQWLIGYEDFFLQMMMNPEFIQALLDRIVEYHLCQWDIILGEVGKYVQVVLLSDDLGTQQYPIMRPQLYRELIKPAQAKVTNFIKSKADVKIVYHCDGAIREFIPDFIELGFDAWNPIQVSADGMNDTAWLKKEYGDRICFWGGGCDSRTVLSKSPKEIREEVRMRVNDLAPGGGLILSSIHNIQRDIPAENVVALYDAFYEFGSKFYKS
ncbi:MAG: uroporphyrinogen decarboxylase family protein [Dysgonamonadaceae bacterium]|jgi:uroporphyrinogen decarboxylase|nr:uroporphyrinogen decarboxylase family protein [Dysgonamonadaceae bacterium]